MKKMTTLALILAEVSSLYGAESSNLYDSDKIPYIGNPFWGKVAVESGYIDGDLQTLKAQIDQRLRDSTLSKDEYELMHAPTAKGGINAGHIKVSDGPEVDVLLFENSGVNHSGVRIHPQSNTSPHSSCTKGQDHGGSMASLIGQIAPKANIIARHIFLEDINRFEKAQIINFSNDISPSHLAPYTDSLKDRIVVKSAGNLSQNLSEQSWEDMADFMLFAGNLRQDYRVATSSGTPGNSPRIQNNFLWVIASDIMAATGPGGSLNQYSPTSGTSNAAAILSGAVAKMKELFPEFSNAQIKECLLESADRDFIQIFEDGYDGIHVSDTHHATEEGRDKYDTSIWGKGILNLKNAIIYGNLKKSTKISTITSKNHRLDQSFEELDIKRTLRTRMLEILEQERNNAAKSIQQKWKFTKERVQNSPKRSPLTIDISKPGFSYERALGEPSISSIQQLTPTQEKTLRNIQTRPYRTGAKKLNVIESKPKIFDDYPFLATLTGSIDHFPTFDELIQTPEQTAQTLIEKFGSKLSLNFHADRFIERNWANPLNFKTVQGVVTPLSRFADLIAMHLSKHRTSLSASEITQPIETFTIKLLAQNNDELNKAALQFLTILQEKYLFSSPSNNLLKELYDRNLLTQRVSRIESQWNDGQARYSFVSMPFYKLSLFTPPQMREIMHETNFNALLQDKEIFLGYAQDVIGYTKPSSDRMIDIMEFFQKYHHILNPEIKNELFKETLMRLELFYGDQKCSHLEFDNWTEKALAMGFDLNKEIFEGREIFKD